MPTPLAFKFGLPLLNREGAFILRAYKNNQAVMDIRLGPTFYSAAVSLKKKLFGDTDPLDPADPVDPPAGPGDDPGGTSASQAHAKTEFSELTSAQNTALGTVETLVAAARKIARRAFKGNATKLHDDYLTGQHDSRTLADIIDRAKTLASSCIADAAAMQAKGWIAGDTTKLTKAIQTLSGADTSQVEALGDQKDATGDRNKDANDFYETLLTIQGAANAEFLEGAVGSDGPRTAFRIGLFPPHQPKRTTKSSAPGPAPAPNPNSPPPVK